jgi:futalosine hydrolase
MFLATAATEIEMAPLRLLLERDLPCFTLVTGAGPVEAAVRLAGFLARSAQKITAVVNVGVAGGYLQPDGESGPALLDLYLAETETFGDLGICYPDRIEFLSEEMTGRISFLMDRNLIADARRICKVHDIPVKIGAFVTVAGVSASLIRGEMLRSRFQGHCENMEGASIARVCAEYSLPLLEIRCISNLVEDRDQKRWRLPEACKRAAWAAAIIIKHLTERL